MRKRLNIRTFIIVTLALLIFASFSVVMINFVYSELSKESVVNTSRYVVNELKKSDNIKECISALTSDSGDLQTYLVVYDNNGNIIGDTLLGEKRDLTDEEAARITDAREGRNAAYFAKCDALNNDLVSYISMFDNKENTYFVKVSSALSSLFPYVSLVFPIAMTIAAIIGIALLKIKGTLYSDIEKPLDEIECALEGLSNGHYDAVETYSKYKEINGVVERLNDYLHQRENVKNFNVTDKKKINFIIHTLPVGILALSDDFTVLLCNNTALRIFKKTKNIVGNKLHEFLADDLLGEKITEIVNANGQGAFTYRLDEKVYRIEISTIEFTDALAVRRDILVVFTDVTAESNLDNMRSEFFANASHELKTPITATLGFSELLLLNPKLDESIKPQVENIHRNSVKMYQLIQDMMELARLDSGAQSEEVIIVDAREIVEFAINTLSPRAQDLNVEFKVRGKAYFYGKYKQVEQIVVNLLSNAVKYNVLDGRVYVDIANTDTETIIKVRDTGKGIPWQDLPRIFERFYCVDKGRTRNAGSSTGLGLSIIKQILIQNNGKITAQSIFGKATQFTVTLPRKESDNSIDVSKFPKYKDDTFDIEERDVFGNDLQIRRIDEVVSVAENVRWNDNEQI